MATNYNQLQQIQYDEKVLTGALNNSGLFEKRDQKIFEKFNMFGFLDVHGRLGKTFEYVFFTKPDLFIFTDNNMSVSSLSPGCRTGEFMSAVYTNPGVLRELCLFLDKNKALSPLLYNYRKSNLELPDLEAAEMESGVNMWGQKIFYRRSSTQSNTDYNFSMQFTDNKYLDIYTYFRLYDLYEELKAYGSIDLSTHDKYREYILNRVQHDQMSVYKFIVGEDGREILYYAKLYGVYPKNVPRSALGDIAEDGNLQITINFKANFVEDMNPMILQDFNILSAKYSSNSEFKALYNQDGYVDNKFADPPFIVPRTVNGRTRYFFNWRW